MAGRVGFTTHTTYTGVLITQCLFALGMGLTIAPATASIMGAVSSARAGVGSAINDTTRQVGGALGGAVMGSIGVSLYRHSINGAAAVEAARYAFIHGLDIASLVGVFVALLGTAIALRFLPAAMKVGAPAPVPLPIAVTSELPERDTTDALVSALSINMEVDL